MASVDVIVPFSPEHTPKRFLQQAVTSIEAQTVATSPIVVRDDMQRGPAWARNTGLSRAGSRFVAFCDADDRWESSKLEKQLETMEYEDSSLCVTQTVRRGTGETNVTPFESTEEFAEDVLFSRSLSFTSSMVVDTAKVKPAFDEELLRREDHLFALQAAAAAGASFLSEPLTEIHKHEEGLSKQDEELTERIASEERFYRRAVAAFPRLKKHEATFWHWRYHRYGRDYYFQNDYYRSIKYLKKALSYNINHRTLGALLVSYLSAIIYR